MLKFTHFSRQCLSGCKLVSFLKIAKRFSKNIFMHEEAGQSVRKGAARAAPDSECFNHLFA